MNPPRIGPRPIQVSASLTVSVVLARTRTNEWACCVNHHGRLDPISREYVSHGTADSTDRKALPAKPSKKRETSIVAMFFATAKSPGISRYTNWGKAHTDHKELAK